jgi:hypothetical protein
MKRAARARGPQSSVEAAEAASAYAGGYSGSIAGASAGRRVNRGQRGGAGAELCARRTERAGLA